MAPDTADNKKEDKVESQPVTKENLKEEGKIEEGSKIEVKEEHPAA